MSLGGFAGGIIQQAGGKREWEGFPSEAETRGPSTNWGTNTRMFPATATEGDAPFRAFVVVIRGGLSCLSLLALSSRHSSF